MACQLGGKKENCVGYCRYHRCNITANQMKQRKCLKKQCKALTRFPHPYWERREVVKQLKKRRKLEELHKEVWSMKDEANDLITAIGAVAELCRELYRQLVKNGFSNYEALELTKTYLVTTMTGSKGKDD